ncbi:MAG: polyprenyl synthetase family protein [Halanaerobiales bacterium]
MKDFDEIIKYEKEKIDQLIIEKIDMLREKADSSLNTIIDSLEYSLKAGGKRIRPILSVRVAKMLGGNLEVASNVGLAVEFIHTYSLIHDDLPAMDDDNYRRGQLSNHKVFGEGIAILAGDALLTLAFEILSQLNLKPKDKLNIISLTADKAGFKGMVGGQSMDLKFEDVRIDLDTLTKLHNYKTGALFKTAVLGGAFCAEPSQDQKKALNNYAEQLGLLFQITDDILDKTGDQDKLGKETGSDEKSKKSTYLTLLGLEKAKEQAEAVAEAAKKELSIFENNVFLTNLIDFILKRDS